METAEDERTIDSESPKSVEIVFESSEGAPPFTCTQAFHEASSVGENDACSMRAYSVSTDEGRLDGDNTPKEIVFEKSISNDADDTTDASSLSDEFEYLPDAPTRLDQADNEAEISIWDAKNAIAASHPDVAVVVTGEVRVTTPVTQVDATSLVDASASQTESTIAIESLRAFVPPEDQAIRLAPREPSLVVAREVEESSMSLDEERAQFIYEVRRAIMAETVHAEQVETEEYHSTNCTDQEVDPTGFRIALSWGIGALVALLIAAGGVTIWLVHRRANELADPRLESFSPSANLESTAPSVSPLVYTENGKQAFTTTPQLYKAVDLYVAAGASVATSSVAMQYGYPIGTWDVSRLTDFSRVFNPGRQQLLESDSRLAERSPFNASLAGWDVSRARTMYAMFAGAETFGGAGLDKWNVSQVTDFSFTFFGASAFNGNISQWSTANARTMQCMFKEASAFNQDVSRFVVDKVESMAYMFHRAKSFQGSDLSNWDVENVENMNHLFAHSILFNGNVSGWNTSKVETMEAMFGNAVAFNGDLSHWSVGNVRTMNKMFNQAYSFQGTQGMANWNTGRVTDMASMFGHCSAFQGNLSTWDVSSVTTMESMFQMCLLFDSDISGWNTINVAVMKEMFNGALAFSSDIASWDTSSLESTTEMFWNADSFNSNLNGWNVERLKDARSMFADADAFNHSLCSWGLQLRDCLVDRMFLNADACLATADPVLASATSMASPLGPFCRPCNDTNS